MVPVKNLAEIVTVNHLGGRIKEGGVGGGQQEPLTLQ